MATFESCVMQTAASRPSGISASFRLPPLFRSSPIDAVPQGPEGPAGALAFGSGVGVGEEGDADARKGEKKEARQRPTEHPQRVEVERHTDTHVLSFSPVQNRAVGLA